MQVRKFPSFFVFLSFFVSFLGVPIRFVINACVIEVGIIQFVQETSKRADLQFRSAKFNDLNLKRQKGTLQIIFTDVFATDKRIILIIPYTPFVGS